MIRKTVSPGLSLNVVFMAAPSTRKYSGQQIFRRYQRVLSNVRMKETRYKLSGTTHSKGITAMSWHNKFVDASSMVVEHALSPIHSKYRNLPGASVSSRYSVLSKRGEPCPLFESVCRQAIAVPSTANAT